MRNTVPALPISSLLAAAADYFADGGTRVRFATGADVVVISAETPAVTDQVNTRRTSALADTLASCDFGADRTRGIGQYTYRDGSGTMVSERSFTLAIPADDDSLSLSRALCVAGAFGQESVLHVDAAGEALLISPSGYVTGMLGPAYIVPAPAEGEDHTFFPAYGVSLVIRNDPPRRSILR